jgi:hypothetical protein
MRSIAKSSTGRLFRAMGVLVVVSAVLGGLPAVCASGDFAFFTTTDFTTGNCSVIELDGSYTVRKNLQPICADAVARYYDGLIYVVNRDGCDNIQVLDPEDDFDTVLQFTTGNGSDPHDIAFVSSTKAYVTRYNEVSMWIVNPSTGSHTGSVDFSSFVDIDGTPEMHYMLLINNYLFVTVQRLDRNTWGPAGQSYVAVVDVNTDAFVDTDPLTPGTQAISLALTNPYSELQLDPYTGLVYVGCSGFWGLRDGGVETIDPDSLRIDGVIFTETSAAGDFLDVEIVSADKGYALIMNASFNSDLIGFNPQTGVKTATIYAPGDYVLGDIDRAPTGELFLTDQTTLNPGVRIYDAMTGNEITMGPIDVGLPPFDITFNVPDQTGVGDTPQLASLGQNYPNPFNPSTTIPFTLEREAHVTLSAYTWRPRGQVECFDRCERSRLGSIFRSHGNGRNSRYEKNDSFEIRTYVPTVNSNRPWPETVNGKIFDNVRHSPGNRRQLYSSSPAVGLRVFLISPRLRLFSKRRSFDAVGGFVLRRRLGSSAAS